jgi:hypothetical protein
VTVPLGLGSSNAHYSTVPFEPPTHARIVFPTGLNRTEQLPTTRRVQKHPIIYIACAMGFWNTCFGIVSMGLGCVFSAPGGGVTLTVSTILMFPDRRFFHFLWKRRRRESNSVVTVDSCWRCFTTSLDRIDNLKLTSHQLSPCPKAPNYI